MLLPHFHDDAEIRNELNVLKRALTLYLAHHSKVVAPMLVGDESDIGTIKTEYEIARDALARVYELKYQLQRDHYADDYDPTDVDVEDAVRNSRVADAICPESCVKLHRAHAKTLDALLSGHSVTDTDRKRAHADLKHALGNETEAADLRSELEEDVEIEAD